MELFSLKISDILTELRQKKGKKQDDIAAALEIKRTRYSGWESGYSEPGAEMLSKLADYHGVTVDYLLGRHEDFLDSNQRMELERILTEADQNLKLHFSNEDIIKIRTTIINTFYNMTNKSSGRQ